MTSILENVSIPFKTSEAPSLVHEIDTENLINKHQLSIEILEGIQMFQKLRSNNIADINGFSGEFPRLRKKYVHQVEIYSMCINRLNLRYKSL